MDIDMAALRSIEREKEIPLDYLVQALEDAMLNAYDKTDHPVRGARVELDRRTGRFAVMVPERDEDNEVVGWYDDTPADFGRVAASTARQVSGPSSGLGMSRNMSAVSRVAPPVRGGVRARQ